MSHLAPGPWRLPVEVKVRAGRVEDARRIRPAADQVDHAGDTERRRRAQRGAGYGTHVVLKLARLGTLDRPVAGVVDARCQLVGEQAATHLEQLEREHSD